MKLFFCALVFLTRLPIPVIHKFEDSDLGQSMATFPLVGLFLGTLLVFVNTVLSPYLPDRLTNIILLTFLVVITGGLHIDGFMDTIDGLAGGQNRDTILEIMRDSRVGALGVVGVFLLLLLKWEALNIIDEETKNAALLVMPVIGRWGQVLLAHISLYARNEGLGLPFLSGLTLGGVVLAFISVIIITSLSIGIFGIGLISVASIIAFTWSWWFKKKIGGVTGDVIGALSELLEVLTLIFFAAFL